MTAEEIAARLNLTHIAEAADRAAWSLNRRGVAHVLVEPGDATRYPFIISHVSVWDVRDGEWVEVEPREFTVTLAASFGCSYPWGGQRMHADYCAQKWAQDCREWTGVVVAEFLSALAERLEEAP